MGFFKDFRDDPARTVDELLSEKDRSEEMVNTLDLEEAAEESEDKMKELLEEFAGEETKDEGKDNTEGNSEKGSNESTKAYGEKMDKDDGAIKENMEDSEKDMEENVDLELLDALNNEEEKTEGKTNEDMRNENTVHAASISEDNKVSIISKGTVIDGNITSNGSLEIMGNVNGDIKCLGKLTVTGKVAGNVTASEVDVNTERLEGSISSQNSVKIGLGTVVIGDVVGTSAIIAGAVKGEVNVNGPVVIDSTAIIMGNIKAKALQINNGAIVEGFCSLAYSDINLDNVFE